MSLAAWDRAEQASSVALSIQEVKSFRVPDMTPLMVLCQAEGVSGVQHEGRGVSMCGLSHCRQTWLWTTIVPVVLMLVHKELKKLFDFLIDSLG